MLLLFPVPATPKLKNSPDKIFSHPCLSKWVYVTKQVLLYYFELSFTAICRSSSKQVFLKLLQIHRISQWNSLDINIRNSSSINAFKKELLKFIKPELNSTYNINDTKGLKLLTRLWLGLSHSGDHKFRHNLHECVSPMCYCVQDINTTTHFLLHCLNHHCAGKILFHKINQVKNHLKTK